MVNPMSAAAIGFAFSTVGWLISPILSRFLNQCFDELKIDVPPGFQSKRQILVAKLEKLQTTLLPKLLILADSAHHSDYRPALEKWIQKLKFAFYEAEHILGLVEYERLDKKVHSLFSSYTSLKLLEEIDIKIQELSPQQDNSLIENLIDVKKSIEESLQKCSSDKKSLIKSIENLEEIVNEAMELIRLLNLSSSGVNNLCRQPNEQHSETISTPDSTVIGRDQDRDYIIKLLREDPPESSNYSKNYYSIIGIWGMSGSGKTTLAQYVCEFERKTIEENNDDKYFDCIIWAHVSQQFSVQAIWKKIWESAFNEVCPSYSSLEGLRSKLEEKLWGQRFLLVLDDVWCDKGVNLEELGKLFSPLKGCKKGSKILVTTRIEKTAKILGAINPIPLRELDEDQFSSLFISTALGNASATDELIEIGKKIASKLHRSPLAAKIVGGQLRGEVDSNIWLSLLNRSLLKDTMGALLVGYQHLPYPLQRCFAFCSLFPKGHLFKNDHLVSLWIAEGFIEIDDSKEHVKDIANKYILELISRSFFQVSKEGINLCYMHDLMHDLAEFVSERETFRIENHEITEIPIHTRHIFIVDYMLGEYVEKICNLEDLRTIVVSKSRFLVKEVNVDALFNKLSKLYVVELQHIERLPKSVIHLKNLRYLSIYKVKQADAIPKSINTLYQLRTLHIGKGYVYHYKGNQIEIPDLGWLILLQDFKEYHVRKSKGFELNQLAHLTHLFGSLSIYNLDNVKSKEDATQANLSKKRGLKELTFKWDNESGDVMRDLDVKILDSLYPPPRVKELVIEGYSGKRLPSWILENSDNIIHLKCLRLNNCRGLEALRGVRELSNLQSLKIYSLSRLKNWVHLPFNLTRLEISYCLSLAFALKKDLEKIMLGKSMAILQIVTFSKNCKRDYYRQSIDYQFKCIQSMIKLGDHIDEQALYAVSNDLMGCLEKRLDLICQIKNIYGELHLPHKLEKLTIDSCFITDKVLEQSMQDLNFLTDLILFDIITITCITDEMLSSLASLKILSITECLLLTSIGGWDTHSTLQRLTISSCPNLTMKASIVANNSNTMQQISSPCKRRSTYSILNYVDLKTCIPLDDCFQNLVSLKTLNITNCPTIVNPHISHLKSLIDLAFKACPNLISLGALSDLTHLKELVMLGCDNFESCSDADKPKWLEKLTIKNFSQLGQLISRDGCSSLVSLTLSGAEEECFTEEDSEVLSYLSSLETISFSNCKIRMMPSLLDIRTLRSVNIGNCADLTSLSELPPSVWSISFGGCNENFKKSCIDKDYPNWQKISHIPEIQIWRF